MRVGITQKQLPTEYGGTIDVLESEYTLYYPKLGITLVPISNVLSDPVYFVKELKIEGLILTGGNGVMPELWGESVTFPNKFSKDRERTEKLLIDYATKERMPVLGVCRGLHYLNVHFGGKLLQNVKEISTMPHVAKDHKVTITDDKAKTFFGGEFFETNSYHNQAITENVLSKDLVPFAVCDDNTVEAAYHKSLPMAGITWHPERKSPNLEFNKKIVEAFVNSQLFWQKN